MVKVRGGHWVPRKACNKGGQMPPPLARPMPVVAVTVNTHPLPLGGGESASTLLEQCFPRGGGVLANNQLEP